MPIKRARGRRANPVHENTVGHELKKKFEAWRSYKLPFEGNQFLNIAFYYGFQWTVYNIATGELSEISNSAGSIRITSNQVQPRIRNLHAKMTKNRPIEDVVPTGWTSKALHSASMTRKLLSRFREIHNEDEMDSQTINWVLTGGDCFRKVGFDPDEGTSKTIDKIDEFKELYQEAGPEADMQGGLTPPEDLGFNATPEGGVEYKLGEVFDDLVTPFEAYVPEYATGMKDTREFMQVKIFPIDFVKERWGRKAANVSPSTNMYMANQFSLRLMGMANPEIGNSAAISRALAHNKQELCYVYELWKKPHKGHPEGSVTICAGDGFTVLYKNKNPYYKAFNAVEPLRQFGGLPFVRFNCIFAPGRFWSISPVEPMRPLQAEYNKTISDVVQNRATVGRNKIIFPKTANIDEEEIANIHGQILQYSGIKEPTILPAVALPVQVERETERNRQDMDTVSGSHEVSRAEVPSGVKSGIAINYLLEQDDTTIAPVIRDYEKSKRYMAMMKIAIAKQFYSEERMIESTDIADALTVQNFVGADLTTNIRIVPGSALPQSRAALQATYLDLFERNAILDEYGQPDTKKLFELLSNTMPVEAFSEEHQLDRMRARRENILLAKGQEIIPQHYEDHKIHLSEHNKFRKTEEFYQLHPVIRGKFDEHVRITVDFMAPPVSIMPEGGMDGKGGNGQTGKPSRKSPSFMGQGSMGALNNPPSNRGTQK